MTMRRISALLALLVCLGAIAAETPPPSPPVSDPDAGSTSTTTDTAKPVAEAAQAPAPKAATPKSTGEKTKDGDFKPSEQISEDMSVAYPVDI